MTEETPSQIAHDVFIARQPIFDSQDRRVAYELLYRASQYATDSGAISADAMCSDTALHAVVSIGLDRLTSGHIAYVNVTREHLLGELHKIFDPAEVVIELLESIEAEPAIIDACARAVADGYTLALDDYDGRPSLDALLPFVKIIKLDVLGATRGELETRLARVRNRGLTLLAERVETLEMRALSTALGCTLFQGYVFSRPETMNGRAMSVQQSTMFSIVSLLGDADVPDSALEEAFQSHPALSFALLRIVNSASFGARSVESIGHAIRLIGRQALSRWMMVMIVASVAAQSPIASEAVTQALIRGRFCELLSLGGSIDPSSQFLVGLLSRIDVLMGSPLHIVLERLPIAPDVRDALLHTRGPHAHVLTLARAYEAGDWAAVDALSNNNASLQGELLAFYSEATAWAAERLASASSVD